MDGDITNDMLTSQGVPGTLKAYGHSFRAPQCTGEEPAQPSPDPCNMRNTVSKHNR